MKIDSLKVTVEQVMSWKPCPEYTEKRVRRLFAGRETLNAFEMAELDIPPEDIVWGLSHKEIVPERILHEFACHVAERALMRERAAGREPDLRSWRAIEAKRLWLQGKATDEELSAARKAAWAAAGAGAKAWEAAAAWAWAAAAAGARARAAAREAAGAAEWEEFLRILLNMLEEEKND